MPSLASVSLIGHLGADPQLQYTQSGQALAKFSVAVSHYKGEGKESATSWFNVTAWGKLAERCADQVTKGKLVFVQGSLEIRKWQGNDGKSGTSVDVTADKVLPLEKTQASPEKDVDGDDLPF